MNEFILSVPWSMLGLMLVAFVLAIMLVAWFVLAVAKRVDEQADKPRGGH
jgi:F0F1-type ATP synthase assembly protein I